MNTKKHLLVAGITLALAAIAVSFMHQKSSVVVAAKLVPLVAVKQAAPVPNSTPTGPNTPGNNSTSTPDAAPAAGVPPADVPAFAADHKLARQSLGLVGVEPLADQYWELAINDLSLTNDQRRELIEDVADTGLPKKPTAADLPVITNRLQLIDQLAPNAIDEINAAAFQEARKDLMNAYNRLTQPPAVP